MFKLGHIDPFWNNLHKELPYVREDFNNNTDIETWRKQGFTQNYFTGSMFDMKNKMPDWTLKFFQLFDGKNIGLSFYKMDTCNILPYHSDTFIVYKKIHNITNNQSIWRAVVFLEDRKPGHIFEIENSILDWKAGDYVLWQYDAPHMAANLGLESRYTAQITFTDV